MVHKISADTIPITKHGVTYKLTPAPEGGYVITVVNYPSCTTQGETIDEALSYAEDALLGCLIVDHEAGLSIPEPLEAWMAWAAQVYAQEDQNTSPTRTYPGA
jgi:predicted RNase H-like HicB family nuclease